jgi:Spy/CpxP family protein refolding chaperone
MNAMTIHANPTRVAGRWLRAGLAAAAAGIVTLGAVAAPGGDAAPPHRHGAPHGASFGGHGPMGGPDGEFFAGPMFPLFPLGRQLQAVGVTAEQRTQIHQIMEAAHTDLKALHDGGGDMREQWRTLFQQPTVDANAAEALRQQMATRHDQASKRMLQAALEVSRVLSPEQRAKLAQMQAARQAERGKRAEQHRRRGDAAQ